MTIFIVILTIYMVYVSRCHLFTNKYNACSLITTTRFYIFMRIFSFLKLFAGLGLILLISSCGGESKDTSPPKRETTSVSGILFDAPIAGARVVLWEYANGAIGKKLGETRT